jgi:hypothetical protein
MRGWRWFFVILETVVAFTFASLIALERFWGLRVEPQSHSWSIILAVSLMFAWLFLLVASPFFLRSLRGVALAGWIIAFGVLLAGILTPLL